MLLAPERRSASLRGGKRRPGRKPGKEEQDGLTVRGHVPRGAGSVRPVQPRRGPTMESSGPKPFQDKGAAPEARDSADLTEEQQKALHGGV